MFRIQLKKLRENSGLSQYSFAAELGVAQSTIGGWESGTREPNLSTLNRIADYFGVTVDYLLGRPSAPAQGGAQQVYNDISSEALLIARAYDLADVRTRQIVSLSLSGEIERVKKAIHKTEAM